MNHFPLSFRLYLRFVLLSDSYKHPPILGLTRVNGCVIQLREHLSGNFVLFLWSLGAAYKIIEWPI